MSFGHFLFLFLDLEQSSVFIIVVFNFLFLILFLEFFFFIIFFLIDLFLPTNLLILFTFLPRPILDFLFFLLLSDEVFRFRPLLPAPESILFPTSLRDCLPLFFKVDFREFPAITSETTFFEKSLAEGRINFFKNGKAYLPYFDKNEITPFPLFEGLYLRKIFIFPSPDTSNLFWFFNKESNSFWDNGRYGDKTIMMM